MPQHRRFIAEAPPPASSSGLNDVDRQISGFSGCSTWTASTWSSLVYQAIDASDVDSASTEIRRMLPAHAEILKLLRCRKPDLRIPKLAGEAMERSASSDDLKPLKQRLELEQGLKKKSMRRTVSTDTLAMDQERMHKNMESMQKWYKGVARCKLKHMETMENRATRLAEEEARRERQVEEAQQFRRDAAAAQADATRVRLRSVSQRNRKQHLEKVQGHLERRACEDIAHEESRKKREEQRQMIQVGLQVQSQRRNFAHERTKRQEEERQEDQRNRMQQRREQADERLRALQEQKKQMQEMRERFRVEGNCQLASIRSAGARLEQLKSSDILRPYGKSRGQDAANTPVFNSKPEERTFSWVAPPPVSPNSPSRDTVAENEWLRSMSNPFENII